LLQPPLETLLDQAHLSLPFEPFPYQLDGIGFLYSQHQAVLADEMGLGKTMQAITAVRLLLHAGEIRQVLLVCPKPLVTNWLREFGLWAPEIPVCAIAGEQPRRHWQWDQSEFPVKIANYEALLRDQIVALDSARHFDLVVLDEAQRIKNRTSTTSRLVSELPRTRSWALTGTPIENCADDLVGIFEFLSPGYLAPGMTPQALRQATHDFILRRTKDQVLHDLPPKLYRDPVLELTTAQQEAYERAEQQGVIRLTELGNGITIQHVFELVLRLKQICNFDPATGQSSKLERLRADLEEISASGQKAIVFSQWVGTLETLTRHLHGFGPLEYHGRTPLRQRDAVLQRFRDDGRANVLLMSYGAGSVGLNLQFTQYVFLFDRWWNPAVEDQAINRAHRIGVAGPVTVTRFTTQGTIEQRIEEVLQQKRELFASVLDPTGGPRQWGLSHHEIFGLFQLAAPAVRRAA
jgi:SNF2 family DNA or RNA helicase